MNALAVVTVLVLGASYLDDTFDRAAAAYQDRDFATASELYEQLISEGVADPVVFCNLGNAYYRQRMLGPAIANYERAVLLEPGLERARENLIQAVRQTERKMKRPQPSELERSLLFWHYGLPSGATRGLAVAFWLVLWGLLTLRLWRPSIPYLRRAATVLAVLCVMLGISAWVKGHPPTWAVAAQSQVPVYYGTNEEETVRFELYEGDRVIVDRREADWARLTTADGKRGWARDEGLAFVGPPYERPAVTPTDRSRQEQP